eukprot:2913323-Amphidinium_carterae.2
MLRMSPLPSTFFGSLRCGRSDSFGFWWPRKRPRARLPAPAEDAETPRQSLGGPRPQAPRVEGPHRLVVVFNTFVRQCLLQDMSCECQA